MRKITKIIAGLLCAAIAGIGVLAISGGQTGIARAENETITSTTTASSSMSIAQLEQIINLLRQQIQQIITLMRQRVIQSPVCGNGKCETGETAATCPQDCSTAAATCAEVCKGKGYADGACTSWAVTAVTGGCGAGQLNMGWTSDCSDPQTTGGGRACCCHNGTADCANEGEIKYPDWTGNENKPHECCAGLTAIVNCTENGAAPNNGTAICTYCGNGVCGKGENKTNCPADCGTTTCAKEGEKIASSQTLQCCAGLNKIPNCAENGECASGAICAYCGNGVCGTGENKTNCPADCGTTTCAKEGEKIASSQTTQCCAGLTKIANCTASGECASGAICTYCGNGVCGTGENKTNCPADCGTTTTCVKEGMKGTAGQKCCDGLTANYGSCISSNESCGSFVCYKCGDGKCSEGESQLYCSKDCGCGNGKCEANENQINCAADCGDAECAREYWPCWESSLASPYGKDFSPERCCAGFVCKMGAISGTCMKESSGLVCTADLSTDECTASGGIYSCPGYASSLGVNRYYQGSADVCYCDCPSADGGAN